MNEPYPAITPPPARLALLWLLVLGGAAAGCAESAGEGNRPPAFLTIHQQEFVIGEAHAPVIVTATDPDGDRLRYTLRGTLWPGTAEATSFRWDEPGDPLPPMMGFSADIHQGVLTWAPLANQQGTHEVTFVVSDGQAEDKERISVVVRPGEDVGGGAPRFTTPSSFVLQLVQTDTLTAAIAVKDDDSTRVTLVLGGQPEGLTFKTTSEDGKRGEFTWRPTPGQIAARAIYGFSATATDDAGNSTVQQIRVVIRLKDGGGLQGDCPATAVPTVEHQPLRDQYGAAPYALTATVTDDGEIVRVFAAFTTKDPQDLGSFQGVELSPIPDQLGRYSGTIPNLTTTDGQDVTYYYYLCAVDDDDPAGDTCDHFWCVPEEAVYTFIAHPREQQAGDCADDAREPNDSPDQVSPGGAGTLPDLWLCPDDLDLFAIEAQAGDELVASILFAAADGDLALELRDPAGTVLDRSASSSDLEQVSAILPTTGVYLLYVTGQFPPDSDGNGYSLTVDLLPASGSCPADAGEPNENAGQASPLPLGDSGPYTICAEDRDVYRFAVNAGDTVTATVDFVHAAGDLDARLFTAAGEDLRVSATSTDQEQVTAVAPTTGELFLEVYGFRGARSSYRLRLEVGGGEGCAGSNDEPNETPGQATPLSPGSHEAAICNRGGEDDVDSYRITLPAFTGLRVTARFSQQQGDLDMLLTDEAGTLLGLAESMDDDEEISFPGLLAEAPVILQIYGYSGAETGYGLELELVPFAGQCLPDLSEPADDQGNPSLVLLGAGGFTQPGLSWCGDEDWYALDLTRTTDLAVGLEFDPGRGGNLLLALLQGDRLLDQDTGRAGSKTVVGEGLPVGRYLLRVYSLETTPNLYTLEALLD
ncbi:MAG: pre-peptidase C-terminal domain-containing protein [Myxococcota bacterium]|jgi:hypothetical protein|nr:pre-peptidase C-terminal domain-containing protein [Myxococcota bacterium]